MGIRSSPLVFNNNDDNNNDSKLDFQSRNKEALVLPFSSPGLRYHFLPVPSGKGLPSMTDGRHVC